MEQQEQQTIEPKCDYLIPNISTYHVSTNLKLLTWIPRMTQNKTKHGNFFPHIFYRTLGANVKKPGSCTLPTGPFGSRKVPKKVVTVTQQILWELVSPKIA